VRRRADKGELESWRDSRSRGDRYISPEAVTRALRDSDVPVASAAEELACTPRKVRALLKLGELRYGIKPGTVRRGSIEDFLARSADDENAA
jgi:hypothetical protein